MGRREEKGRKRYRERKTKGSINDLLRKKSQTCCMGLGTDIHLGGFLAVKSQREIGSVTSTKRETEMAEFKEGNGSIPSV